MKRTIATLALALLPACQGSTPAPAPKAAPPAAFTDGLLDVGGRALHAHCVGVGVPAVVFDAGLGLDGSAWRDVQAEVGRVTRACAYDRAGLGYSAPASGPRANRRMARALFALLERAGVGGPYVLVGHSMGGINLRLLASEHPGDVAGMVLVDAMGDDQASRYWALAPEAELAAFRAGLPKGPEGLDFGTLVAGLAEMRASSRSLGDKPLVVLTRGKEDAPPGAPPERAAQMLAAWQGMQTELARLSSNSVQVVARNGHHNLMWDAPGLVVASVREVVEAARARRRVNRSALDSLADEGPPLRAIDKTLASVASGVAARRGRGVPAAHHQSLPRTTGRARYHRAAGAAGDRSGDGFRELVPIDGLVAVQIELFDDALHPHAAGEPVADARVFEQLLELVGADPAVAVAVVSVEELTHAFGARVAVLLLHKRLNLLYELFLLFRHAGLRAAGLADGVLGIVARRH